MMTFYDAARGLWRTMLASNGMSWRTYPRLPRRYAHFFRQWRQFRSMGGEAEWAQLHPVFFDDTAATQTGGGQYFFQDIWALRQLSEMKPSEHHDFGSRLDGFVGQATAICPVVFWDIRPPCFELPGLTYRQGSLLELPIEDESLHSISCLHTVEHVGLGRYGDPLDPRGTEKSLTELARVCARGGHLLVSMPIGQERVCFNAHRIWHPEHLLEVLADLRLVEFAAVSDDGRFLPHASPADLAQSQHACGFYKMVRDAN